MGSVVLGLDTWTVKVKLPPGAGRLGGLAALVTAITGVNSGVRVTVACAVAVTMLPLLSTPVTVTVSVWLAPDTPVKEPVKLHGADVAPGASVVPMRAPQVDPARVARFP